jgi:hypothetical protein
MSHIEKKSRDRLFQKQVREDTIEKNRKLIEEKGTSEDKNFEGRNAVYRAGVHSKVEKAIDEIFELLVANANANVDPQKLLALRVEVYEIILPVVN